MADDRGGARRRVTLSGVMQEGDLSSIDLPELLTLFELSNKTGVLRLRPTERDLEIHVAFAEGIVIGVSSRLLPPWRRALEGVGIAASTLEAHRRSDDTATEVLTRLVESGHLTPEVLALLLRRRARMALSLVRALGPVDFEFIVEITLPTWPGAGTRPATLNLELAEELIELERCHADSLMATTVYARTPDPLDEARFAEASPMARQLLAELARPTPLWELGRRLDLVWSELAPAVVELERLGAAVPDETSSGDRLRSGEIAPRFSLPAAGGERWTLGRLFGRPVHLAFYPSAADPRARARVAQLQDADADLVMVTRDAPEALPPDGGVVWLADPDGRVAERYGVRRSLFAPLHPSSLLTALRGRGLSWRPPAEFRLSPSLRVERSWYKRPPSRQTRGGADLQTAAG